MGPTEVSGWTIYAPWNPRVRPMSATELRRGEQSALHCSGTRTLQVRNPSSHPTTAHPGHPPLPASWPFPECPPPPSPGEPPGRGPGRGVPLRRGAGRGAHTGGRVPGVRRAAAGRAGSARVSGRGRGAGSRWAPAPARPAAPARVQPRPAACRFSCTVFTFGQTGSGKTYTLTGPPPQVREAPAEPSKVGAGGRGSWELQAAGGSPRMGLG